MSTSSQNFINYEIYNNTQRALSTAFANQVSNEYFRYSNLWSDIFSNRKSANELSDLLIAFNEKNTISHGVSSALPERKRTIFTEYYQTLLERAELENLPMSWLGSPTVIDFNGLPASVNYLQNLRLFTEIRKILNSYTNIKKPLRIVEIGAGYGGLAYFLLKSGIAETYTIIDLPENLKLSTFFLTQSFQEKPYLIPSSGQAIPIKDNLGLTFVPPGNISSIENWTFDLAINSDSLGEMPAETAQAYIKWIHSHLDDDGYFFTKNGHNRGEDTVKFPHQYGYQNFTFRVLEPSKAISSLFDDFSHYALLQKSINNTQQYPDYYLNCLCSLYALGLQNELAQISEAYSNYSINDQQNIFLTVCNKFFSSKNLNEKMFLLDQYEFSESHESCITYLKGITQFLLGDLKNASALLSKYLLASQSYIAETYALMIMAHNDPRVLYSNYKHGAKTRYAIDEIITFHNFNSIKKYLALKLRADILKKKINYPGNYSPSMLLKLKNIAFNFKERRKISNNRNININ